MEAERASERVLRQEKALPALKCSMLEISRKSWRKMITEVYKQTLEIFCTGRNHDYSESIWSWFNDIFIALQFLKLKCNDNISLFPPANFTNVLTWSLSSSRLVCSLRNSWLHMCMCPAHTNMHTCIPKFEKRNLLS